MKVKELAAQLAVLDQELEVLCYTEDDGLVGGQPTLLDIVGVKAEEAERLRSEHGRPALKFGRSDRSERVALVKVTGDF